MPRTDYTVVRNHNYNRGELSIHERHNERKNTDYANEDIVPERTCLNVHFKQPDATYTTCFDKLVQDGVISTRGLKPDAHIVCEFVFDVNTAWFDEKGGYDFAKDFFAEAYKMAVKEVGDERYILSAVMHADERNKGLSEQLGRDVFHYHLHVVYIPVVDKEIRWSKRCKDEALRGMVKEVIHQVSCSKKWAFQDALDDQGKPLQNAKGKPVRIPSYRQLQDRFFEHMRAAGYDELQRGEMGSNAKNLTTLEYKLQQEQKRLDETTALADKQEAKVEKLTAQLSKGKKMIMTFDQLDNAGRKTPSRKTGA